jgi:hypothetical protein
MPYTNTTGTNTNYGSQFSFPSGTMIVPAQVVSFPEIAMGERNVTNHGNGGFEERKPNGLISVSDFTLQILSTPNALATLKTDMEAKTERTSHLKNLINQYTFVAWIKSIKEEDADATSPDSVMATIVVTPVGSITLANS